MQANNYSPSPILLSRDELMSLMASDVDLARAYALARARLTKIVERARNPRPPALPKTPKTPEEKREANRIRQQKHRANKSNA